MKLLQSRTSRGMFLTILGGISWAVSGTCGQYLFAHYDVSSLWLTCVRLLAGGILLTLLALLRKPASVRGIWRARRDRIQLFLYGIFGLLLVQYAYLTGIYWTNAATATVLQNLGPVLIMLWTCLQYRRLPSKNEVIALALALLGIYLLATGGKPGQMMLSPQGLFWGLTAALGVVSYTLLPRPLLVNWDRDAVIGLAMLIGGIAINLLARSWTITVHLPLRGWLAVAAVVLLGTVIAFSLVTQGITELGPVHSSMLNAVEPLTATVLSTLWLGTAFTVTDIIAFVAILTTVVLLARTENTQ